tara:strand:+ start:4270 stop:4881 length:612 start_codon:yes stop_codon:yes gene_type:complete
MKLKKLESYQDYYDAQNGRSGMKASQIDIKLINDIFNLETEDKDIHILDIGCRDATAVDFFYKQGFKHIYGFDIGERAKETWYNTYDSGFVDEHLAVADVHEGIPFDKKFQLILSSHVIEHLYDAPKALNHMYDHLVDGGFLHTQVPIQPEERFLNAKPHYYMFDTMDDYISLFDSTKFKVVYQAEGFRAANPEAILILQKIG